MFNIYLGGILPRDKPPHKCLSRKKSKGLALYFEKRKKKRKKKNLLLFIFSPFPLKSAKGFTDAKCPSERNKLKEFKPWPELAMATVK